MNTIDTAPLGREVAYPRAYDPSLLFPIARGRGRSALGLAGGMLPFVGHDRWHAYELAWLDARGKPQVDTGTLYVPADSPCLIESKSLKLYLNSINAHRFADRDAVRATLVADLSAAAGATVEFAFGLPAVAPLTGTSIDNEDIVIASYGPPDAALLHADATRVVDETLTSQLLKSNCPVTGQPDWASVSIAYCGPCIARDALLRYLISFRDHAGFHEQCVERIFIDLMARCVPQTLSVEARYTRRGGLDINPWRATPGLSPPPLARDARQ